MVYVLSLNIERIAHFQAIFYIASERSAVSSAIYDLSLGSAISP